MKKVSNVNRFLGLMLVFGAVGALGISALPNAFANSPSVSYDPSLPVVNGNAPTIILTGSSDMTAPHLDVRVGFEEPASTGLITMEDPTVTPGPFPPGGGDCGLRLYDPASTGGSYWAFEDGAGNELMFDIMAPGDTVRLLFAPGTINPMYTGTATGPASGEWVDKSGNAKDPSIDFLTSITANPIDVYRTRYCGWDTGAGFNEIFDTRKSMQTQLSMAGEIIPIDSTALFIGGISTPAMMLPLLAAAAGGAFIYLRFQVPRKD